MGEDPQRAMESGGSDTTVVVVGAGVSGLVAARELRRHGIEVIVVEAADRVGGRTLTETTALGSRVDLGGQWIGHDHHRVSALAAELGATRFPMHTGTLPILIDRSKRLPAAAPAVLLSVLILLFAEALSRTGITRRWNATTVASWLARVPGWSTRKLLDVIAAISWTADLDRLSIHAAARMIRNQGGLFTMLSTRGGAQDSLLVEGMGSLAERLADELGARIRLGQRVLSIEQGESGVIVRTSAGEITAAKVIVTVPPPLLDRITYKPELPTAHAELASAGYMGSVYKAIAVYERPFWRERAGGEFLILDAPGRAVFDTTPPGGPGHLCVLVGGPAARDLDRLDPAARRDAVLGTLVRHIGPEVNEAVGWHEKSWSHDEYVGGGYMAVPEPGTTAGLPPLRFDPAGAIHWAGTERAADHAGYVEGAIESGTRAAREVVAAL
ncbi:flavin monoamine oxidase family protein [Nocardia sp. NPDC056100]|uniref:flavin monoamine oxidase family protein n=1 Tax=Nocardia sp. NPDC056100 TaxID=3345712 RepID=UPI0035D9D37E